MHPLPCGFVTPVGTTGRATFGWRVSAEGIFLVSKVSIWSRMAYAVGITARIRLSAHLLVKQQYTKTIAFTANFKNLRNKIFAEVFGSSR